MNNNTILNWTENNKVIFAELKTLRPIFAELRSVQWWNIWRRHKLQKQYDSILLAASDKSSLNTLWRMGEK